MKLLRLVLDVSETSGAYYLFSVPFSKICDQTILSLFEPELIPLDSLNIINTKKSIIDYIKKLYKEIKYNRYDVVHAHTPHVGILAYFVCLFILNKRKTPKLFSIHYSFNHIKLRNKLMLIPIFITFDSIVFCSKASFNSFPSLYKKLVENKYKLIYNGVNTEIKPTIHRDKKNEKFFNIITVSRLEKFKNIQKVIEALSKINDDSIKLKIVGDGAAKEYLENKAKKYNHNKNIQFLGQVPRKEVIFNLSNSDLFISLSNSEGFPVSVLEALINKCAVVLSNIEPHLDLAKNNQIIDIVEINDEKKLVDRILYHKKMNSKKRSLLGKKCNQFVDENYSQSVMINNYFTEYKKLLKTNY